MKFLTIFLCAGIMLSAVSANAALIAYWDQNSNDLPGGGFGFTAADFPQAADQGAGSISIVDFDATTGGVDNDYTTIHSFAGTTDNAQPSISSGGSLVAQGGPSQVNNGMSILVEVDTTGFEDIMVSWAQRGTGSGFNSREFSYSTDGGTSFTSFATDTNSGSFGFEVKSYDLSGVSGLNNLGSVIFSITLDGSTGTTGNNRFDNITVEGTPAIPEPASAILVLLGVSLAGAATMRSRLG